MRYGIDDVGASPLVAAVFLLGTAAAGVALLTADGTFGAVAGSPEWWVGLAVAAFAALLTAVRLVR